MRSNKRFAEDIFNVFDIFVKSEDEPATTVVGRWKRPRRGDVPEDIVDDDEPACEARHLLVKQHIQPPRSARQTLEAQRPTSQNDTKPATLREPGESLAGGGWQVKEILGEGQTDAGLKYKVI